MNMMHSAKLHTILTHFGAYESVWEFDNNFHLISYYAQEEAMTPSEVELKNLKESLRDTQPVGVIVNCCRTLDQVIVVVIFGRMK